MSKVSKLRKKLEALRSRLPSEAKPISKTVVLEVKVHDKDGKKTSKFFTNNPPQHKKPHELWMEAVEQTFADGSALNKYMEPFRASLTKVKFEKDGTMVDNEAGYYAQHSFPSIYRIYRAALLNQRFAEEGTSDIEKIKKRKKRKIKN
jgi:hypothetical protein